MFEQKSRAGLPSVHGLWTKVATGIRGHLQEDLKRGIGQEDVSHRRQTSWPLSPGRMASLDGVLDWITMA